jgi:hypothetical protein
MMADQYTQFMERCDASMRKSADEVQRSMAAINLQLERGHLSDKSVADGILGVLNQTYAAIMGTQDSVEEFRTAMEMAGMIPPRKDGADGRP